MPNANRRSRLGKNGKHEWMHDSELKGQGNTPINMSWLSILCGAMTTGTGLIEGGMYDYCQIVFLCLFCID